MTAWSNTTPSRSILHLLHRSWTPRPRYSSSASSFTANPVFSQLADVVELSERVNTESSRNKKARIIMEYPHLRDLLETVYDPNHRTNITSRALRSYWDSTTTHSDPSSSSGSSNGAAPGSLLELLDDLASKRVTGNAAKSLCSAFVNTHINPISVGQSSNGRQVQRREVEEVFLKLIDRNLVAGFGARTLMSVPWNGGGTTKASSPTPTPSLRVSNRSSQSSSSAPRLSSPSSSSSSPPNTTTSTTTDPPSSTTSQSRSINLNSFSCALGKSIEPPFTDLAKRGGTWYASRKLDGVRVIALLDFIIPTTASSPPKFRSATFVSRSGNPFTSLFRLEEQLVHLEGYPDLRALLDRDPLVIDTTPSGQIKRLVLDGEVCVMQKVLDGQKSRMKDDGTGASALWQDEGYIEDFSGAVSAVKTDATMENPAYFLFDLLNWTEVTHTSAQTGLGLGKTFGERIPETKGLANWLKAELEARSQESRIRALVQWPIQVGDVDRMVERAAEEGWEGLIFRADQPYKGKRSVDIRKFKKWQDAEYEVLDLDTNIMRLPINGAYGEYEACANVWIEHKGCRVSVGSGFTAEGRVKYAKDPSLIVGKQITVQYFSESDAAGRPGVKSLRFPRIKAVWDGKRTI